MVQSPEERWKLAAGKLFLVIIVGVTGLVCGGLGFVAGAGIF